MLLATGFSLRRLLISQEGARCYALMCVTVLFALVIHLLNLLVRVLTRFAARFFLMLFILLATYKTFFVVFYPSFHFILAR